MPDESVRRLFVDEAGRLRGYLIRCGASSEDADDCVQDGFLALAQLGRRTVDSSLQYPLAYAYAVARHKLAKNHKLAGREMPSDQYENVADRVNPFDDLDREQEAKTVRWALDQMPPNRAREAINLRFMVGFDVKTTASIMGVSSGAVKRYSADGLAMIRVILEEENVEGDGR
jgi:RNA polymerase sigma-70 factor (ECF subfamily)